MKFNNIFRIFSALKLQHKIIIATFILFIVGIFFFVGKKSVQPSAFPLYGLEYKISQKDMEKVETSLKSMKIAYTKQSDQIFVDDEQTAMRVRTQLGIDGFIPTGVKGWELFDNQPFTTTDFERKVNVRRAITDNIKKHLELLADIESADVVISFGEEKYFADDKKEYPLTASVVIRSKGTSDILTNKNKIRGMRDLVAKSVDELQPDNVVIMDSNGTVLTKSLEPNIQDENVQIAKEHLHIKEQERMKIYEELKNHLTRVFTKDRFDVKVNLELNWDIEKSRQNLILPTVIKERNPNSAYDDSIVKESVTVSQKQTQETFKGQGYIPEGPAGIEDQVPPGLKEKMDRYNTYEKNEVINNQEFSKAEKEIVRQPYVISKVTVSVFLDGVWSKVRQVNGDYIVKNGTLERKFAAVTKEEAREIEESVKALVGFNHTRGDSVAVTSIQFDRTEQFTQEDEKFLRDLQRKQFIVAIVLGVLALFILVIILRVIKQVIDRRRRLREEQLLREQEALRLAAMRGLNEAAPGSLLEKAANEMQEQAIRYAKEKPEDVAKLIRTWLNSDD